MRTFMLGPTTQQRLATVAAVIFDLFETLITEAGTGPLRASDMAAQLGLDSVAFKPLWKDRRGLIVRGRLSLFQALKDVSIALTGRADTEALTSSPF